MGGGYLKPVQQQSDKLNYARWGISTLFSVINLELTTQNTQLEVKEVGSERRKKRSNKKRNKEKEERKRKERRKERGKKEEGKE